MKGGTTQRVSDDELDSSLHSGLKANTRTSACLRVVLNFAQQLTLGRWQKADNLHWADLCALAKTASAETA